MRSVKKLFFDIFDAKMEDPRDFLIIRRDGLAAGGKLVVLQILRFV